MSCPLLLALAVCSSQTTCPLNPTTCTWSWSVPLTWSALGCRPHSGCLFRLPSSCERRQVPLQQSLADREMRFTSPYIVPASLAHTTVDANVTSDHASAPPGWDWILSEQALENQLYAADLIAWASAWEQLAAQAANTSASFAASAVPIVSEVSLAAASGLASLSISTTKVQASAAGSAAAALAKARALNAKARELRIGGMTEARATRTLHGRRELKREMRSRFFRELIKLVVPVLQPVLSLLLLVFGFRAVALFVDAAPVCMPPHGETHKNAQPAEAEMPAESLASAPALSEIEALAGSSLLAETGLLAKTVAVAEARFLAETRTLAEYVLSERCEELSTKLAVAEFAVTELVPAVLAPTELVPTELATTGFAATEKVNPRLRSTNQPAPSLEGLDASAAQSAAFLPKQTLALEAFEYSPTQLAAIRQETAQPDAIQLDAIKLDAIQLEAAQLDASQHEAIQLELSLSYAMAEKEQPAESPAESPADKENPRSLQRSARASLGRGERSPRPSLGGGGLSPRPSLSKLLGLGGSRLSSPALVRQSTSVSGKPSTPVSAAEPLRSLSARHDLEELAPAADVVAPTADKVAAEAPAASPQPVQSPVAPLVAVCRPSSTSPPPRPSSCRASLSGKVTALRSFDFPDSLPNSLVLPRTKSLGDSVATNMRNAKTAEAGEAKAAIPMVAVSRSSAFEETASSPVKLVRASLITPSSPSSNRLLDELASLRSFTACPTRSEARAAAAAQARDETISRAAAKRRSNEKAALAQMCNSVPNSRRGLLVTAGAISSPLVRVPDAAVRVAAVEMLTAPITVRAELVPVAPADASPAPTTLDESLASPGSLPLLAAAKASPMTLPPLAVVLASSVRPEVPSESEGIPSEQGQTVSLSTTTTSSSWRQGDTPEQQRTHESAQHSKESEGRKDTPGRRRFFRIRGKTVSMSPEAIVIDQLSSDESSSQASSDSSSESRSPSGSPGSPPDSPLRAAAAGAATNVSPTTTEEEYQQAVCGAPPSAASMAAVSSAAFARSPPFKSYRSSPHYSYRSNQSNHSGFSSSTYSSTYSPYHPSPYVGKAPYSPFQSPAYETYEPFDPENPQSGSSHASAGAAFPAVYEGDETEGSKAAQQQALPLSLLPKVCEILSDGEALWRVGSSEWNASPAALDFKATVPVPSLAELSESLPLCLLPAAYASEANESGPASPAHRGAQGASLLSTAFYDSPANRPCRRHKESSDSDDSDQLEATELAKVRQSVQMHLLHRMIDDQEAEAAMRERQGIQLRLLGMVSNRVEAEAHERLELERLEIARAAQERVEKELNAVRAVTNVEVKREAAPAAADLAAALTAAATALRGAAELAGASVTISTATSAATAATALPAIAPAAPSKSPPSLSLPPPPAEDGFRSRPLATHAKSLALAPKDPLERPTGASGHVADSAEPSSALLPSDAPTPLGAAAKWTKRRGRQTLARQLAMEALAAASRRAASDEGHANGQVAAQTTAACQGSEIAGPSAKAGEGTLSPSRKESAREAQGFTPRSLSTAAITRRARLVAVEQSAVSQVSQPSDSKASVWPDASDEAWLLGPHKGLGTLGAPLSAGPASHALQFRRRWRAFIASAENTRQLSIYASPRPPPPARPGPAEKNARRLRAMGLVHFG